MLHPFFPYFFNNRVSVSLGMVMCPGIKILSSNTILAKANEIYTKSVGQNFKGKPLKDQADFADTSLFFSSLQMEY